MDFWGRKGGKEQRERKKPAVNYERKFSVIWLLLSKTRSSPGDFSVICCHLIVPASGLGTLLTLPRLMPFQRCGG